MTSWYYYTKYIKEKKCTANKIHDYYNDLLNYLIKTNDDLDTKCRVCLQKGTVGVYGVERSSDIIESLQIFGDITMNDYDEYPKMLCDNCYMFIKTAVLFRRLAKKSEEVLKQPLKEESYLDIDQVSNQSSDNGDVETKPIWQTHEDIQPDIDKVKKEKKEKPKYSPKVTCHICNKVINRSYYKEHVTMHDPDHKKYVCDVCGKSFRLRCAYHNHSLRHRSDFPYKCTFCPYRGRYAELLKTHMRTHTGDYRYMCTECPARFLFKSNLNSHMLKHKEPQHKCDTCKRAFHTTLALQRHFEADHLGIKNHVCNICGKAFGYRNAMMKHQRHVHKREKLLFGRMPSYLEAENKKHDNLI